MSQPERTCVGCRQRSVKSELLRLVRLRGSVAVDVRQRQPGRGAYLHRDRQCLDLAIRRRAVGRALRTEAVDVALLTKTVSALLDSGASTP